MNHYSRTSINYFTRSVTSSSKNLNTIVTSTSAHNAIFLMMPSTRFQITLFLFSIATLASLAFQRNTYLCRGYSIRSSTLKMLNDLNPKDQRNEKASFFGPVSRGPAEDDIDESFSKGFLPSGPADLATVETTELQRSNSISKR